MLTINHDNYDTWLMLYLDNELTAAEREAVEAFARANPAVQEELEGLKETILQPGLPAEMPGKERLLMPEIWNEEALTPQQQQLLLLADNELEAAERVSLENTISQSPLLKKEWALLQKTRVASGKPMEMPGKDKLYRHERTRVIPFGRVIRFAAAAAILGFGWFFVNDRMQEPANESGSTGVASVQSTEEAVFPPVGGNDTTVYPEVEINQPLKEAAINLAVKDGGNANSENFQPAIAKNTFPGSDKAITKGLTEQEQAGEMVASANTREPAGKLVATEVIEVEGILENEPLPVVNAVNLNLAINPANEESQSSIEISDTDEFADEGTISIGGARISKQKIRHVYRNLTRPIARKLERSSIPLAYVK
jgi:hypothetical protein